MNNFMQEGWSWIEGTHGMRTALLDSLTDADLGFTPGGQNITLGALCREMGDVEHSYIESFKTFKQDWTYHNSDAGIETSVSKLKAWAEVLDAEMKTTASALSDDDFKKTIDRGGFTMPVELQFQVYLQALLIFFGKATVYLKAMKKPLPTQIQDWIG